MSDVRRGVTETDAGTKPHEESLNMITENGVLATLRRVPDRIILATMGRDINLMDGDACLCAWFVAEKLAEIRGVGASSIDMSREPVVTPCSNHFGGDPFEWNAIFVGVTNDDEMPTIERAFVRRVDEAVFGESR